MLRAFDVGAVVAALPAGSTTVVAGREGMGRQVIRVSVAAAGEDLGRLGPHELVVAEAAMLATTGEPTAELVARLERAGVAGMAVHVEPQGQLPAELVAAADRAELPIIAFTGRVTLADVTAAVLDALLEAQRGRLERILDIHQRFTRIVLAGGGASEIAVTLHDLLSRPVAVVDAEGRPVLVVPDDAATDVGDPRPSTVRQPIRAGGEDYGAVVAFLGEDELDEDGRVALERAAVSMAVRLAQASAVAAAQARFAAVSLEELISGRARDVADVAERAVSFGWDLSRPRAVLLASIDPPEHGPIPPRALDTVTAAARATLGPDAIVWTRRGAVAALVAPATSAPSERRHIAETLRHELDARLRSVHVSIGVGRRVDEPSELWRSFAEASRAVDVGRWAKGRHVTEVFDQLGLERLLAATPTEDLADFVEDTIGSLAAYDRSNRTELVETLAVWLETRNMAEAARRVFVHYNTMKNRLERIEAVLGPVTTNPTKALECEVAIYLERHYGERWRGPGSVPVTS